MRADVFLFQPINCHNIIVYKSISNVNFDESQKSNKLDKNTFSQSYFSLSRYSNN